jgi:hypothetical protein
MSRSDFESNIIVKYVMYCCFLKVISKWPYFYSLGISNTEC